MIYNTITYIPLILGLIFFWVAVQIYVFFVQVIFVISFANIIGLISPLLETLAVVIQSRSP